ncbi:unnamed protein product [Rotaria magnacalcarata]|uniref:DNA mismatch repair protein MSH2 n=10 Tax=Rotaria magnacalcarata TaxID=392030 RepID=A0A819RIF7_9BILA|nr:unnamed protein product [Rotaria magnacalcarata]CAF2060712.1 unnamed protein product [Rotaria magnacalcarata]CAF2225900.1 unnamed protein product [Rotaria magnacalcarata]CAF4048304.1 unnamed protein product [Rotaria magnacalcarata]CAF4076521.1 unnamed protein product [Rotaria magnacalcarata]
MDIDDDEVLNETANVLNDGITSTVDTDFYSVYKKLPTKTAVTIRLFERNEYYTCHGDDALFIARELLRSTNALKYWKTSDGNKPLETIYVSNRQFEDILRQLLLVKQYRIEVWKKPQKISNEWTLAYHGSPGNLTQFEDILFSSSSISQESSGVLSCKLATENGVIVVGLALIDVQTLTIKLCEVTVSTHYSNLETILVQLGPKECLLPTFTTAEDNYLQLKKVIEKSGVLVTERPKADFISKDIKQDLCRLLIKGKNEDSEKFEMKVGVMPEMQMEHAKCALSAAIKFLQLLGEKSQLNRFHLKTHQPDLYMRLDTAAMIALNIFPDNRQRPDFSANSKSSSLYGLLNNCRTAQGQRLLMQWLKQPLTDAAKINERLDIVDAFVNDTGIRNYITQDFLGRIPDFERLVRKFIRKKANLEDCYKIYVAVNKMPKLVEYINDFNGPTKDVLHHLVVQPIQGMIDIFSKYIEMIETTIDLNRIGNHEYVIKPGYDKDLAECRKKQDELESKMHDDLASVCEKLSSHLSSTPSRASMSKKNGTESSREPIRLVYDPKQGGWLYRINRKESATLQKQLPNITIQVTKKEGIFFQTPRLNELNGKYSTLNASYNETSKELIEEVLTIAASYCDSLSQLAEILAQLDCLVSFAIASVNGNYIRPIFSSEEKKIHLVDSRHPCVEKQDSINFISNTVQLDRNNHRFQVITGPNMGGKSTYIRQVGVIQLMAQVGCFVPCTTCHTTVVDCILARLGANDDLALGVSTFMSEMLEMSTILDIATSNSLVIIDELGRGTSTYDGFGLAWAVANYICTTIKCFCLFATHFHELTSIEHEHPGLIQNFHVDALPVDDQLVLLYKLKPGVCDQSFGIHVAQLAQFPEHVLEFAKKRAQELEEFNTSENGKENPGQGFASSESIDLIWGELEKLKSINDQEQAHKMVLSLLNKAQNVGLL